MPSLAAVGCAGPGTEEDCPSDGFLLGLFEDGDDATLFFFLFRRCVFLSDGDMAFHTCAGSREVVSIRGTTLSRPVCGLAPFVEAEAAARAFFFCSRTCFLRAEGDIDFQMSGGRRLTALFTRVASFDGTFVLAPGALLPRCRSGGIDDEPTPEVV